MPELVQDVCGEVHALPKVLVFSELTHRSQLNSEVDCVFFDFSGPVPVPTGDEGMCLDERSFHVRRQVNSLWYLPFVVAEFVGRDCDN